MANRGGDSILSLVVYSGGFGTGVSVGPPLPNPVPLKNA
jgi:hypothetical protein